MTSSSSRMSDFPETQDCEKDETRREFDTYCETIQSNKTTRDDKTDAVMKGWALLLKIYLESRNKDFPVLFDRLYLATAKLILGGEWYGAITENNYKNGDVLKNGLLKSLDALIAEVSIEYPMECKFCLNLKPLLDRSPWSLSYITDIIAPNNSSDYSAVEELWKEENETLVDVRLELLCSSKEYQKAFSIASACYQEKERSQLSLEDRISDSSGNFKNEQLEKRKSFNQELTNFFYLLLCVNVCRNKSTTDMEKFLSVPTAVEVVSYLSDISPSRQRLASKWKEWKKACKTIISTTTDFFIKQQLEDIDVDLSWRVFNYWIKHAAKNEEDIRPAKDLLDQINQINTDLIYVFADVLYDNFKSRSNSIQKTVELYFRAMSKDINQIEKLDVTDNQADKKQSLKNKLASRYLRLAKLFACDDKVSWELTLTAFSLSPSEDLFKQLFPVEPISSTSTTDSPLFELSPALKEDLHTVIANPRWKSLCWVKDKIELEQLCRQQLDTGGPKIRAKEDLTHLHIDYEKYEPRQEYLDENDFGFEKGYEPKNFGAFGDLRKKRRGTAKSSLLNKALPRRKPFPTAFNKQGKKKIFGVTQSTSTNQPKIHGVSKGVAKKLSDIKQMRIIKKQSQPNNQESFQELQSDILRMKRFGRRTPRFSQLYTEKYVLDLDSCLKHLYFPRCMSDTGEAEEEEPKVSTSFSRFTGNQACAGNEMEKVNMATLNCNDFNSKYLLGLEAVIVTLENQMQSKASQLARSQELARLCSEIYPDSFTLEPCLFTKSVDPHVTLENLIPLDFVQSSATNLAFNYIIQVMNKSLDAFWGACRNPAMSETFKAAIETQVDEPELNPDSTIPRIISEVCQYNGTHATLEGLTGAASTISLSAPKKPIKKQIGPRRTTNRRYAQRLIARASCTMSHNIALKRQALGLEFLNGNLIRASTLSDASVNFQSVSTIIKEVSASGQTNELQVPPAYPSITKFQFHRFENFIIAQAEMSERTLLGTSTTDLPIDQPQAISLSEVIPTSEQKHSEETKDFNPPTAESLAKTDQECAPGSTSNTVVSEMVVTQETRICDLPENLHEQGGALNGEQTSSQEQARASVPLVCSIVKLAFGDCVRNNTSPYLPDPIKSPTESEPDSTKSPEWEPDSIKSPKSETDSIKSSPVWEPDSIRSPEEEPYSIKYPPEEEPYSIKYPPEEEPYSIKYPLESEPEPEVDDAVEAKNEANDSDYAPFTPSNSPVSPITPVVTKKRSSVGGKNKPKPKRFKFGMNSELTTKRKSKKKKSSALTIPTADCLPPLSFLPPNQVVPPPKQVVNDNDALENHSKFIDGIDYLDDCTGYFDTIGDLDLNFPSPETSEQPWDDTFGICSDTEEQQNKTWLTDWKRNNPEEPNNIESGVEIEKTTHPCDSRLKENSVCSSTKSVSDTDEATSSKNETLRRASVEPSHPENPEADMSKGHPIKPCFVLVEKLSSINGSQDSEAQDSYNGTLGAVKHLSDEESCASVVSNSSRSNSSKSLSGSEYRMDQGSKRKVVQKRRGRGRPPKKILGETSSKSGKSNRTSISLAKKKGRPKSKQSSSDEGEREPSVQSRTRKQRGRAKPSPKSKRKSVRKRSKRRQSSTEDSEDSGSIQLIELDDSESHESHSDEPEVLEELPESNMKPMDTNTEMNAEALSEEHKTETRWQKLEIAATEDDVIDVTSDKEEEVDPLDVSHVAGNGSEDDPQKQQVLPDLPASIEQPEELPENKFGQRDYSKRLSVDSNSSRKLVSNANRIGESYLIVKSVGDDKTKLPGVDTSSGLLTVHVELSKTEGIVLVNEGSRSCTDNIQDTESHEEIRTMMINDNQDLPSDDEEEMVILGVPNIVDSPEANFLEEDEVLGDVQDNYHGRVDGSANAVTTEGVVEDEDDEDQKIPNEEGIFIEPEDMRKQLHNNQILPYVHIPDINLPVAESEQVVHNEPLIIPIGETLDTTQLEPEVHVLEVIPVNREVHTVEDDVTEVASEGTTETETDCDEHLDKFLNEENDGLFNDVSPEVQKDAEDRSCVLKHNVCSAETYETSVIKAECTENIQQNLGSTIAVDEDANHVVGQKSAANFHGVNCKVQNLESSVLEQIKTYITLPNGNEQCQSLRSECDRTEVRTVEIPDGQLHSGNEKSLGEHKNKCNLVLESNPSDSSSVDENIDTCRLASVEDTDNSQSQVVTKVNGTSEGGHQVLLPYAREDLLAVNSSCHSKQEEASILSGDQNTVDITLKVIKNEITTLIDPGNAELAPVNNSEFTKGDSSNSVANVGLELASVKIELPSVKTELPSVSETFIKSEEIGEAVSDETQPIVKLISEKLSSISPAIEVRENVNKSNAPIPAQVKKIVNVTVTTLYDSEFKTAQDQSCLHQTLADMEEFPKPVRAANATNNSLPFTSKTSEKLQACESKKKVAAVVTEEARDNQGSPDVNPLENHFGLEEDTNFTSNRYNLTHQCKDTEPGTGNASSFCLTTPCLDRSVGKDSFPYDSAVEKFSSDGSLSSIDTFPFGINYSSQSNQEVNCKSGIIEENVEVNKKRLLGSNRTENSLSTTLEDVAEKPEENLSSSSGIMADKIGLSNNDGKSSDEGLLISTDNQAIIECSQYGESSERSTKNPTESDAHLGSSINSIQPNDCNHQTGANDKTLESYVAGRSASTCSLEEFQTSTSSNSMEQALSVRKDNNQDSVLDQSCCIDTALPPERTASTDTSDGQPPIKIRRRQVVHHDSKLGGRKSQRVAENQKRKHESIEEIDNCEEEAAILKGEPPIKLAQTLRKDEELSVSNSFGSECKTLEFKRKRKSKKVGKEKQISNASNSPDEEVARILQHKNGWDAKKQPDKNKNNKMNSRELALVPPNVDFAAVSVPNNKITGDMCSNESVTPDPLVTELSTEASQTIWTPCSENMPDIAVERYSALSSSPPASVSLSLVTEKNVPSNSYRLRQRKIHGTLSTEAKDMSDSEDKDGSGVAPILSPEISTNVTKPREKSSVVAFQEKKQALSPEITNTFNTTKRPKRLRTVNNTVDTQYCKRNKKDTVKIIELEHSESPPILSKPEDNITLLSFGETDSCKSPLPPILEPEV